MDIQLARFKSLCEIYIVKTPEKSILKIRCQACRHAMKHLVCIDRDDGSETNYWHCSNCTQVQVKITERKPRKKVLHDIA